jgi:hypothetical protein
MLEAWTELYSSSAVIRTAVTFAHVGGVLFGGGCAIAADRATLRADPGDSAQLRLLAQTHRAVLIGLAFVATSGLLLLAANLETYLTSRLYWTKMLLVVFLLMNGLRLTRAEGAARAGAASGWARLRGASQTSLILWFLIALLGVSLPNV